jgi:polar amino acid transport system permease protein
VHYEWDFSFLLQYKSLIWIGVAYTMGFTVLTSVLGLLVGSVVALGRLAGRIWLTVPLVAFTEVFRCTPVLVQLVWCYYALPVVLGIELSPTSAALITLSCYGGSFYTEIIRGGIRSVERGQWDAGRALGMTRGKLMRNVVLPQAFKQMIPPLVNQTILQLNNTSLISVLAVPDLLYQGQLITSATYRPLEVYTMVAVVYFVLLLPLTQFARWLEICLSRSTA